MERVDLDCKRLPSSAQISNLFVMLLHDLRLLSISADKRGTDSEIRITAAYDKQLTSESFSSLHVACPARYYY
jgi:hypothetical protein